MVQRTTGQVGWGQAPKGSICRPGPAVGGWVLAGPRDGEQVLGPGFWNRQRSHTPGQGTVEEREQDPGGHSSPALRSQRQEMNSSGHAWCQVVRYSEDTPRQDARGQGAWVQSACVLCLAVPQGQWGRWGSGEFGRLVNRNAAQTAARRGRPTPPWASGPTPWRRSHNARPPALPAGPGKAGVLALVPLALIAGAFWPPQLLYLLIDLPVAAPSILPLYPEDVFLIHMAHVIVLILLILLVLPLLLLTLHLHPHLALDI